MAHSTKFLILLSLALVLAACSKSSSAAIPAALPQGWPVPELTLPPGAAEHVLPERQGIGHNAKLLRIEYVFPEKNGVTTRTPGSGSQGNWWAAGFSTEMLWPDLVKHVDGCLLPLGYTVLKEQAPKNTPQKDSAIKAYLSPDRMQVASIRYVLCSDQGEEDAGYQLEIIETPVPLSPELEAAYLL